MGVLSFSHFRVRNVKIINGENSLIITVWMSMNPYKSILFLTFLKTTKSSMYWGCPGMLKSISDMDMVPNRSESIISLFRDYFAIGSGNLNSQILKDNFRLPTIMSVYSNISLSSRLYWYTDLRSCKYLESEAHLRNAQVNKASSVNKGIAKICLVVDMVRKNWSWTVLGCITSFQLILVHFETLLILGQSKDLNICFSQLWKFISWRV